MVNGGLMVVYSGSHCSHDPCHSEEVFSGNKGWVFMWISLAIQYYHSDFDDETFQARRDGGK